MVAPLCICGLHFVIQCMIFEGWQKESEWAIKFNGLSGDTGQQGPYKPCNYNLYIGTIICPHIDNTQSAGHNQL